MTPFEIATLAFTYGPAILSAVQTGLSNEDITTKVKALGPEVATLFEGIGSDLFPKAAPQLHIVAGVIASADLNYVKWLQGALNTYLALSPALAVDGKYGPKTQAAVTTLQQKLGLTVDGVAGKVTEAVLKQLLAKH